MTKPKNAVWTQDIVLGYARTKPFTVSKYLWRDDYLRRLCRKMVKRGLLKVINQTGDSVVYRAVEEKDVTQIYYGA